MRALTLATSLFPLLSSLVSATPAPGTLYTVDGPAHNRILAKRIASLNSPEGYAAASTGAGVVPRSHVPGDLPPSYLAEFEKRQTNDGVSEFCRLWGHTSTVVDERLYISGGIATFKENFKKGQIYLCRCMRYTYITLEGVWRVCGEKSGMGLEYPVVGNDPVYSYVGPNKDGESTQMGALWYDGGSSIYKYGGWFADNNTWSMVNQTTIREAQLWRFDIVNSQWIQAELDSHRIVRAYGGAVAEVPAKKKGYFLGGIISPDTDPHFAHAPGYEILADSFLHFDSGNVEVENRTASALGPVALASMVHIPDMGDEGVLVLIGGITGPQGEWIREGTTDGVTLRPMDSVHVYDIANDRWYEQSTSGTPPLGRQSACAVVVPSQDKTSWQVVVYGGTSEKANGPVYGDTWVLTLPSFQWVKVNDRGDKRFEHTCHLVKGNMMLAVGGRDHQQDSAADPANNYTINPVDWSCLKQGLLSSLDLNTFEWTDRLPMNEEDYLVHDSIVSLVGGNSTGGATTLDPLYGWSDSSLKIIMFIPTAGSNGKGNGGAVGGHGHGDDDDGPSIGPIVGGVVGGVVLIALVALIWVLMRRRSKKANEKSATAVAPPAAAATTAVPPPAAPPAAPHYDPHQSMLYTQSPAPQYWPTAAAAPPGYVYDPHSGAYYQPVPTPAPHSPHPAEFYKPAMGSMGHPGMAELGGPAGQTPHELQ
ncbi:hypothetical protein BDZ91DRAFT_766000 [Kalaharituber pfeilii]|nr:hypothetical protein BDZ91DRAFT_766000 [Kalaharituber pfeilii]